MASPPRITGSSGSPSPSFRLCGLSPTSDSKSCVDLAYDPVSFKKTKHILRAAYGLRDYVSRDVFSMSHIAGTTNLADILTKAQAVSVFNSLIAMYDAYAESVANLAPPATA